MIAWHALRRPLERMALEIAWRVADLVADASDIPLLGQPDGSRLIKEYLRYARRVDASSGPRGGRPGKEGWGHGVLR